MGKQLNVWIDGDLKDALKEQARFQEISLTALVEGYLRKGIERQRGEIMERQALPAIRKAFRVELSKGNKALLAELDEYLQSRILDEIRTLIRRGVSS
jgi:hypothetical protein